MVLPDFLFGLLSQSFHLEFLIVAHADCSSEGISHILDGMEAVLFEYADDFGSGEYEFYFFHEEKTKGVLVGVDILDKFDVKSHHRIKQFFGHVVAVKEFFKFK